MNLLRQAGNKLCSFWSVRQTQTVSPWRQTGNKFRKYWSWHNLNPLNWSALEVKWFLASFFIIMLPVFFWIGFQPIPVDAASLPQLQIPSINLETPVTSVQLIDHQLEVPATIAGIYTQAENKLFILGHSSTVFKNLSSVQVGSTLSYDHKTYQIIKTTVVPKADISMRQILQAEAEETIIIMTCAGEPLPHQDATHRLIVTATLATQPSNVADVK